MQEVALAKEVVVLCGDKVIEWRRMVAMGELLRMDANRGFGRAMGDEIIRLSAIKEKLLSLTATNDGAKDGSNTRGNWFGALLHDTRVFSAGNPRDKVFAILGITKRFGASQSCLPAGAPSPYRTD